jgi:hypothetical protein
LIEARLRLVSQQAPLDHFRHELRHDEHFALGIVGKVLVQVPDDVSKDIEAN